MKRCPDPECGWSSPDPRANFCPKHRLRLVPVRPDEDPMGLVGERLSDGSRVTRFLGEGTFGAVYLVGHEMLDEPRVVKVLKPEFVQDRSNFGRFRQEAQLLDKLSRRSEHLVDFYQPIHDDQRGLYYLVMEYVQQDGEPAPTLDQVLAAEGPLQPERALRLIGQLCAALGEAHRFGDGVIHRDLKLENLMLTRDEDGGDVLKVLDFGIAKQLGRPSEFTSHLGMPGTPGYAPPEQMDALEEKIGPWTDLFAVGVILYELITGKDPWLGKARTETYSAEDRARLKRCVEKQAPIPLHEAAPELHPKWVEQLQPLLDRTLHKKHNRRLAGTVELLEALEAIEPPPPAPPPEMVGEEADEGRPPEGRPPVDRYDSGPGGVPPWTVRALAAGAIVAVVAGLVWLASLAPGGGAATTPVSSGPAPSTVERPTADLTASALSIEKGDAVTLRWETTDADRVSIAGRGALDDELLSHGEQGANDSLTLRPDQTTTYTLTATGPGGVVSDNLTVLVTDPDAASGGGGEPAWTFEPPIRFPPPRSGRGDEPAGNIDLPIRFTLFGTLNIRSNKGGARAYVDGTELGPTPHEARLVAGEHLVEVKKAGCEDASRTVNVVAFSEETIDLRLTCVVLEKTFDTAADLPEGATSGRVENGFLVTSRSTILAPSYMAFPGYRIETSVSFRERPSSNRGAGLVFGLCDWDNYWAFEVAGDNYAVWRRADGEWTRVKSGSRPASTFGLLRLAPRLAVEIGGNVLHVVAKLSVDGEVVDEVDMGDSGDYCGRTGVFVNGTDTVAAFGYFRALAY